MLPSISNLINFAFKVTARLSPLKPDKPLRIKVSRHFQLPVFALLKTGENG
jgi:hypothetical protein